MQSSRMHLAYYDQHEHTLSKTESANERERARTQERMNRNRSESGRRNSSRARTSPPASSRMRHDNAQSRESSSRVRSRLAFGLPPPPSAARLGWLGFIGLGIRPKFSILLPKSENGASVTTSTLLGIGRKNVLHVREPVTNRESHRTNTPRHTHNSRDSFQCCSEKRSSGSCSVWHQVRGYLVTRFVVKFA